MADVEQTVDQASANIGAAHSEPFESIVGSLLFWTTFFIAAAMYAGLVLAPRLIQSSQLQQQHRNLAHQVDARAADIAHLDRLATALANDPDFRSRVALDEFSIVSDQKTQITVTSDLQFDARVPRVHILSEHVQSESLLVRQLQPLAIDERFRKRWGVATACVVFFAFGVFNSQVLSGAISRRLSESLRSFVTRYQRGGEFESADL